MTLSIKQLEQLKGVVWEDFVDEPIDGPFVLFWHAMKELASVLSTYVDLGDVLQEAPYAILVLFGGADYFAERGTPRPYAVERLLLQLDRLNAGLDPDGE